MGRIKILERWLWLGGLVSQSNVREKENCCLCGLHYWSQASLLIFVPERRFKCLRTNIIKEVARLKLQEECSVDEQSKETVKND